jgi:hypothetical protein
MRAPCSAATRMTEGGIIIYDAFIISNLPQRVDFAACLADCIVNFVTYEPVGVYKLRPR